MNDAPLSKRTLILLLLFFGIAVYSNTFQAPFYFDDFRQIVNNFAFRPPFSIERIWQPLPSRLIANISFAMQYSFTGTAPWGFHLVNLLIHLLSSLAVFETTRCILRTPAIEHEIPAPQQNLFAFFTALFFAVHPLQTEAITYIVQRYTSLATLFYITALLMYLKARLEHPKFYVLALFFTILAMLTKEISFTLPLAILLTDFCFFPLSKKESVRKKLLRWLPFMLLLGVIPTAMYQGFGYLTPPAGGIINSLPKDPSSAVSRGEYFLTQFRVVRTYLRLLFFPVNQSLDYDYAVSPSGGDPDTWSALLLLSSIFIFATALYRKRRLIAFGIFWFFLTLIVESTIIPIQDVIVEHRLYLPMFGFALVLSSFLWSCCRSVPRFTAIAFLIAVIFSGMTYARNELWKDPLTLWQDTIRVSPRKGRAYVAIGNIYAGTFKNDKLALVYYQKAMDLGVRTTAILNNIALSSLRSGKKERGLFFQKLALSMAASEQGSHQSDTLLNHAISLGNEKKMSEAITAMKEAIRINPQDPKLQIFLGKLYADTQQEKDAIVSFRKAIEIAPTLKDGYDALALFYSNKKEEQKALDVYLEYIRFKRKHGSLFGN